MKSHRRPVRHAQIHLPPLGAGYALTLVDIFERAIAAIWRAHGDRMAELLEMRRAAAESPQTERVVDGDSNASDDESPESEWLEDGDPNAADDTPF
jgi:hypothetical protein